MLSKRVKQVDTKEIHVFKNFVNYCELVELAKVDPTNKKIQDKMKKNDFNKGNAANNFFVKLINEFTNLSLTNEGLPSYVTQKDLMIILRAFHDKNYNYVFAGIPNVADRLINKDATNWKSFLNELIHNNDSSSKRLIGILSYQPQSKFSSTLSNFSVKLTRLINMSNMMFLDDQQSRIIRDYLKPDQMKQNLMTLSDDLLEQKGNVAGLTILSSQTNDKNLQDDLDQANAKLKDCFEKFYVEAMSQLHNINGRLNHKLNGNHFFGQKSLWSMNTESVRTLKEVRVALAKLIEQVCVENEAVLQMESKNLGHRAA